MYRFSWWLGHYRFSNVFLAIKEMVSIQLSFPSRRRWLWPHSNTQIHQIQLSITPKITYSISETRTACIFKIVTQVWNSIVTISPEWPGLKLAMTLLHLGQLWMNVLSRSSGGGRMKYQVGRLKVNKDCLFDTWNRLKSMPSTKSKTCRNNTDNRLCKTSSLPRWTCYPNRWSHSRGNGGKRLALGQTHIQQ